jgi:inner membrane protein YidH
LLKNYSDHAANERTYLAWVRTGITVSVFGFVIEKFELFVAELPRLAMGQPKDAILPNPEIRILSMFLVVFGIGVILLSTWHFVRTRRAIESNDFVAYNEFLPAYVLSALLSAAGIALLVGLLPLV